MRSVFKWVFRILGIFGVVTTMLLLLYIFSAPAIAERKILAALRELGVDEASVRVRSIGASHLQITNLKLGQDAGLTIGAVGVDYSLSAAGNVRVKMIEIIGAELDLRMREGKLDLGPLADIKTSGEPGLASEGVPFDVLTLRASSLLLELDGRRFAVPLEATLTHKGQGECDVDARITLLGAQVPLTGTIDFTAFLSPVTIPPENPPAEGIRFNLAAPVGETSLTIVGSAGKINAIAVSLPQAPSPAVPFKFDAVLVRGESGSKIVVRASGASKELDLLLAGSGIEMRGVDYNLAAEIDLDSAKATASARFDAQSISILAAGTSAQIHKPAFKTQITADWSTGLAVRSEEDSSLSFAGIDLVVGDERGTMDGATLLPSLDLSIPARGAGDRSPRLSLGAGVKKLAARMGKNEISFDAAMLTVALSRDGDGRPVAQGIATVSNGHVAAQAAGLTLSGIDAAVPVRINSPVAAGAVPQPSFHIRTIRHKDDTFAAISGTVAMDDGIVKADLNWPLFDEAPAKVKVDIDLRGGMTGRVTARVQDLHIKDDTLVAKKLKAAQAFRVTGHFGLDAEIAFAGGTVTPRIALSVRDATFASGKLDFVARGINTNVTLNSFAPLSTLPNQRLAARDGNLGKLNFKNAILNFRLDAADAMVIELAGWSVGEKGRFWVHAARFDPLKPVLETQVFIEDMSVAEWLSIIQDGEVKGEGYMYGRLPIRVDQGSDLILTFGEGFLYAKPGKGWVRLSERAEVRRQAYTTLEEAIADLTQEAKLRMLEAVNDFEFDTLKFDFVRENKGVLAVVTTSGRGRTGFKQPIGGLTVNIHNFGSLLSKQFLRSTDSLGAIDDVLKRVFEGQ